MNLNKISKDIEVGLEYYRGGAPAGFASPAEDEDASRLDINEYLIDNPNSTFYIRVKGDSMIESGIMPNSIAVVDKSKSPKHGDIVLAILNNEFTIKQLSIKGKGKDQTLELMPANSEYEPIQITQDDDFNVWGVVTGTVNRFSN